MSLHPGAWCEITGLEASPQHNGKCCTLTKFDQAIGRWKVKLESGEDFAVRPRNLKGTQSWMDRPSERKVMSKTTALPTITKVPPAEKLVASSGKGELETVRTLLERGLDVDGRSKVGSTALMAAARRGHDHVCLLLLEHKADPNLGRDGFTAPLPTDHNLGKEGFSALHIACVNGHEKVVGVLLAGGADVMMQANHVRAVGRTLPLHEAAKQGTCEVVAMLLEAGEKVGVNVRNMLGRQNVEGDTALHLASRAGRAQLVEFLCTLNAPRSVLNNQGKRPEEEANGKKTRAAFKDGRVSKVVNSGDVPETMQPSAVELLEYDDTAHGHVTVTSAWESTARAISPPIDDDVFNLTPLGWAEQPPSAAAGVGGPAGGQQPTQSFGEGLHIPGVLREHEAPHPPKPRPRDPLEPPPPVRYLRRSSSSTEPSVPSSFRFSSPQRGASVRAVDALPAWGGGHFVPSGERVQQAGVLGGGAMHDTWGGLLEHPVSTLGGGVEEGVGEAQARVREAGRENQVRMVEMAAAARVKHGEQMTWVMRKHQAALASSKAKHVALRASVEVAWRVAGRRFGET